LLKYHFGSFYKLWYAIISLANQSLQIILKVKGKFVMEKVGLVIQSGIGSIFFIYGIYVLLSNRKKEKQTRNNFVFSLVYILVGIFLLGFVVYRAL
jgi:hypothetical protein